MGIGTDTYYAATLLIHTNQHGNSHGFPCGILISLNGLNQFIADAVEEKIDSAKK